MLGSRHVVAALLALTVSTATAFQPVLLPTHKIQQRGYQPYSVASSSVLRNGRAVWSRQKQSSLLSAAPLEEDETRNDGSHAKKGSRLSRFRRRISNFFKRRLVVAIFVGSSIGGLWTPQTAEASAPVMAVPKAEQRDPVTDAILNHERKMVQKQQQELSEMNAKARQIEATEGTAARIKFEKEYKEQKEKEVQERAEGLIELKRSLLDQGIDPFTSIEGQRQVILYEKGIDLGKVPGTMMYLEKQLESQSGKRYQKSLAYKQADNRRVVKAMVQDMKNKGQDPLVYFENHQEQTQTIMAMPPAAAAQLALKYEANLEQYGQINVPKEGEMSAKERMAKEAASKPKDKEQQKKEKEEKKRAKAEAKAKAAAEKKAAKEAAKAAKEAEKKEKAAAKASKAAAAAAAMAVTGADSVGKSVTGAAVDAAVDAVTPASSSSEEGMDISGTVSTDADTTAEESTSVAPPAAKPSKKANTVNIGGSEIPVLPLAGVGVVAVGGGGYAFKIMQERAADAEEERERQFRLLMGMDGDEDTSTPGSSPALEVIDDGLDSSPSIDTPPEAVPPPAPKTGKKKRRGFFAKKNKNNRETDLNVLVSEGATAPQFAALLSKILTYGAPGRFPSVAALPGEMPFEDFELEAAKKKLTEALDEAGITREESAEVFANVVNCMLIDIVDLASSTLKAKDDKVTVDGIGVVIDFMNHAASLYDSVAGDTVIEPVTYGGDLSKGQLEKMYSAYATSGMMNLGDMDTDFDARVSLLQDAFQISEKKAQGLAMKAMQKNLMKMMKSGDLEEMMKGMGGEDGLAGLAGMEGMMGADGDVDPERLKESLMMLKQMKDSGAFAPEDLEEVKKQFREAYGSSLDEVIKQGGEEGVDTADMELLDLMKSILED